MNRRLRVLYYNTFLTANAPEGMVSRQFLAAARQLTEWNLVTVPAPGTFASQRNSLRKNGVSLRSQVKKRIPVSVRDSIRNFLSPVSRYPIGPYRHTRRMTAALDRALDHEDGFDLLLLHLSQGDLEILTRLCHKTSLPVVIRVPAPLSYEADHVFQRYMSQRDRHNERFLYDRANVILVISEGMKQILVDQGVSRSKVFTFPNGVDFNTFALEQVDDSIVRHRHDLAEYKVVGYVGSFWKGNDMATLLRAWQVIEATEPTAKLLLVGDGPGFSEIRQLARDLNLRSCIWVGRVQHTQIPEYIAAMDVAVGPYSAEAVAFVSPLKVMEYAAMGRPVVATNGGQIAEIVEEGITGYTYDAGSAEQLAEKILALLSSPHEARRMGKEAYRRMQTWYSWDRIAFDTMSLCRQMVVEQAS